VIERRQSIRTMSVKNHLKQFCPPVLLDWFNSSLGRSISFSGVYPRWDEAAANAAGYDAAAILKQAIDATRKVVSGEAASERDGVAFVEPLYPFPLIAALLMAAAENDGKLTVLDFGGALGSTFVQCRPFLKSLKHVQWCIVEQPSFVAVGNSEFSSDGLTFFEEMSDVWSVCKPTVILFSSSLQYLPQPFAVLRAAIDSGPDYIVVDRNPFIDSGKSQISLQKIPRRIVQSSYPVWLFSEAEFRSIFSGSYSEVASFDAIDGTIGRGPLRATFKGIVFRKNERISKL
jgi:putative methyltransferase (TIGR04325 family)